MFVKNIIKRGSLFLLLFGILFTMSCATADESGLSQSFTTDCSEGIIIPFSDKVDYDLLWEDVISLVSKRFEIVSAQKDSGIIKTSPKSFTYVKIGDSLVRQGAPISLILSKKRRQIEIRSEAGCDARELETMKQDLQGISGY